MKILSTLSGLIIDDRRLAGILIVFLIFSWGSSYFLHQRLLAGGLIGASLLLSLWFSVLHQLQLKLKGK